LHTEAYRISCGFSLLATEGHSLKLLGDTVFNVHVPTEITVMIDEMPFERYQFPQVSHKNFVRRFQSKTAKKSIETGR
jgi:hypothetical protein